MGKDFFKFSNFTKLSKLFQLRQFLLNFAVTTFRKEAYNRGIMKGCTPNMVKYLLFIFNLLFAISGIGLIIAGSIVLADVAEYKHFMESRIIAPPIVLIVAGAIIFFVAFLGCYGAIRENYYLLIAFAVFLLIIFIVELAVGIAAAVYKSDFQMILKDSLRSSMEKYHDSKADRLAWDNIQTKLECCGVESPTDWPAKRRPYTCCHAVRDNADPPEDFHCQDAAAGDEIIYSDGCYAKLQTKAESNAKILIGVGIGIAFLQLVGIILACWLASVIKNRSE